MSVMPAPGFDPEIVASIQVLVLRSKKGVDGWNKSGHDGIEAFL